MTEIRDLAMLAPIEAGLGGIYLRLGNHTQAETHLRRSVTLFDKLD
jgi:hypothetical protein